jgi:hypothetical protein
VPHWINGAYHIYRESTDHRRIETIGLWLANVPRGGSAACGIGPVKALPLVAARIADPAVTVNGERIVFPVEMAAGDCLELESAGECRLYAGDGSLRGRVEPRGVVPSLKTGPNEVSFDCRPLSEGIAPRARITVMSRGRPLS